MLFVCSVIYCVSEVDLLFMIGLLLSCSLETTLRNYSCLTTGDSIMVAYNNKKYYIDIIETKPSNAISIIETDCEVDFAPPLDYKEPEKPVASAGPNKAISQGAYFSVLFALYTLFQLSFTICGPWYVSLCFAM